MDDPIEARLVHEALHRLAEDARSGQLGSVDDYVAAFPAIAERVRAEYADLMSDRASGSAGDEAGAVPIDGTCVGPYRIQRELGRGGQGVVYLAEDVRHGRRVALKVLPTPLGLQSARVRREIDAIARLDHPGLCVVYDAGEADGRAYVAMRHVQGEALDVRVREWSAVGKSGVASGSRGRSDVVERVELIEKVARALHAAHEVGVTHRDVKPANILVRDDGDPVLLDFGLARLDDSEPNLTRSGELVGTLPYMAPERLAGGAGDTPVGDVWSLGVTLYEVLAAKRPFEGPTLDAVARRIERDEPTDLRRLAAAVPRDLAVIVATALSKDPFRRYPTAAAFADDLERWRAGRPIDARPVGPLGRVVRWARRNPAAAALGVVLVVALIAALLAANRLSDLAERESRANELAQQRLESEGRARQLAQAMLTRGSFDQARLELRAGHGPRAAELADRATSTWTLLGERSDDGNDSDLDVAFENLPTPAEMRGLHAELAGVIDIRPLHVVQRSTFSSGALSADASVLVQGWINADMSSYGLRTVDVASGEELARLTDYDLMSTRFALAVTNDGNWCVAPRRDLSALGLWSLRTGRCEAWLDVPTEVVDLEQGGSWKLAFADDGTAVVGVLTSQQGRDAVVVWRHGIASEIWRDPARSRLPYAPADSLTLPTIAPESVDLAAIDSDAWFALTPDRQEIFTPGAVGTVTRRNLVTGHVESWNVPNDITIGAHVPGLDALLVASPSGRVSLVTAGRTLTEFNLGIGLRRVLGVHPERPIVAVVDTDLALRLVHLHTGEQLARVGSALEETQNVDELRFTPEGAQLVSHPSRGATTVWSLDLERGWRGTPLARPAVGALSWAWSASGTEVAEIHDGVAIARAVDGAATRLDEALWTTVDASDGAWVLTDAEAGRAARVAWPRDDTPTLSVHIGDERELIAAVALTNGLRVFARASGGVFVGDATVDDPTLHWHALETPDACALVPSPSARLCAVIPLTGARFPSRLSTGEVVVHGLDDHTTMSLEGLGVGFRDVKRATISADDRWLAAHVFRPAPVDELEAGDDWFSGLWDLAADGALVASRPSVSTIGASASAYVDDRWLAVAGVHGDVALYDLASPSDDAWLTWRALDDDVVPRLASAAGSLIAWPPGAPERARRFDVTRLYDDLAARGLAASR